MPEESPVRRFMADVVAGRVQGQAPAFRNLEEAAAFEDAFINRWFGPEPWGAVCADLPRQPIPVGERCFSCEEEVERNGCGVTQMCECKRRPLHVECYIATGVGSLAHQQGRCSCYGPGNYELENSGQYTRRELARWAAWLFFATRESELALTTTREGESAREFPALIPQTE